MAEGLGTSEVVEVQRLDAAQRLVVTFCTDGTENLAVIISQQLIEDVDAEIACGTCQQDVANRLALPSRNLSSVLAARRALSGA